MNFLCLVYGDAVGDLDGGRLRPAATATTVRVLDGQTLVSDGPFAETPEELAGFRVLDCASLEEALSLAAGLGGRAVEVRPAYVEASS